MGKVFDALKKAEQERREGAARPAAPPPPEASAAVTAPAPPLSSEPVIEREAPRTTVPPSRKRGRRRARMGLGESLRTVWCWARAMGRERPDEETATVKRRIIQYDPYSPAAEQFRAIRTRIELLDEAGACRVLAVTSALHGEGKTLTAINLALVMAMSLNRRVALVDCDLRKPRVHETLGLPVEFGLTEVLRGEAVLDRAILELPKENLYVLAAGTLPSNPAELLGSAPMRQIIASLRERFDYVILDTPAALPVADPAILASLVDGIIFVVRAGSTPREQVLSAMENFSRDRIVGVVLNASEEAASKPYENRD
jgi:capsular exopolysaccharide synthesis family protein